MNDQKFGFFKFLKLKYRGWDQMVLPKKLGHPSWILGNIEKLRKGLLHHVEGIEI